MSDPRLHELDTRLTHLEKQVSGLQEMLGEMARLYPNILPATSAATDVKRVETRAGSEERPARLSLIGRTLLVLGGGFLLRAATEAGTLPPMGGVGLALLYSMVWLVFASRAAQRGHRVSASLHALATALIAFPLLVESTLQLEILDRRFTAILLPIVWLVGSVVAARRRIRPVAWIFAVGAGSTGLALAVGSGFWAPFPYTVLLMTLGGLWLGYLRGWAGLAVVGSAVADALGFIMPLLLLMQPSGIPTQELTPGSVLGMQLGLVTLYLASFLARALLFGEHIRIPEIMQALTAFVIGVGGAIVLVRFHPSVEGVLAPYLAAVAVLSYAVSFVFVDRRSERRRNFAFFSSSALVAALVGGALLLDGLALTLVFLVFAGVATAAGARFRRATLSLHGAAFVVGAALSSGLFGLSLRALVGAPADVPSSSTLIRVGLVLAVALSCASASVPLHGATLGRWAWVSKAVNLFVLFVGFVGLAANFGARLATDPSSPDAGVVAAVRTSVVAVAAIALGGVSHLSRYHDTRRLVPFGLTIGALLLALGDLRSGRPATLVVSMGLYGGALILAPRLARTGDHSAHEADDDDPEGPR